MGDTVFITAVLLAIFASLCFGLATPMYKQSLEKLALMNVKSLKNNLKGNIRQVVTNKFFALATFFQAIGTVVFLISLSGAEVSIVSPVLALTYVFTAIYSHFALKEVLSLSEVFGITLIILGVILITLPIA
ncbi:MAG: EamA family transporter [Candidatus Odinarchaeia archaeon]